MKEEKKRLFFGAEITAAWPKELPDGRLLDEKARHMTLAFLGETSFAKLQARLSSIPRPGFHVGLVGRADRLLFLPEREPHVVAAHVELFHGDDLLHAYQKNLLAWLKEQKYPVDERPFLPHVTIARAPFSKAEWKEVHEEIPLFVSAIHLYESVGNLTYQPLWTHPLHVPFEELEHTADIAFRIFGEDLHQIHLHAKMALAFKYPPILKYISADSIEHSLDDIVIALNELVAKADEEIGTPFKAVSFHGSVKQRDSLLEWEMIVDV